MENKWKSLNLKICILYREILYKLNLYWKTNENHSIWKSAFYIGKSYINSICIGKQMKILRGIKISKISFVNHFLIVLEWTILKRLIFITSLNKIICWGLYIVYKTQRMSIFLFWIFREHLFKIINTKLLNRNGSKWQ